ncbi:hypothetical protein FA893_16220 [Photobacterium damselae subsp. piscicida]|uniref:Lecithin retinol acyltransferase family protein n=1 Tax=Photobacterium damsela subsp. piscicida TaxID=38294 RepID=A0A1Q9GT88_PHODP|nr:lecithin retinol acyltransferase family protein [Photobacterium damselae]MBE8127044.1 lecithin retinol acyltransferase family protein [Photobacterium damselae subsp. piscicida]MDP2514876.1 lecithin retinol acyltransferase family protein [Photobacterium damselae subsp. piscicida]MDP2531614.1 lecithin retinol acyltransferase family protein [Photobacterium damselae subsp. piscicida]MDP2558219.1 lecithin retinol acyltransferase family protein [Photobacterium damselae subsp. piscicida]MDP2567794
MTISGYQVQPGDIVAVDFGRYDHWALVSDKVCHQGKRMLISATKRNGTVMEETWDEVTQGQKVVLSKLHCHNDVSGSLEKARSQIGVWQYSVYKRNCEHFIYWVLSDKLRSKQVIGGVSGAVLGAIGVVTLSKKPSVLKVLGGAWAGLTSGVILAKASNKTRKKS